uniref:Uncharacterized protein n=1 Tax=Arundo donax TaxID=35708 RepID=A0A0A8Y7P1_ARUDO
MCAKWCRGGSFLGVPRCKKSWGRADRLHGFQCAHHVCRLARP